MDAQRTVRSGQVALGALLLVTIALHPGIVLRRHEVGLSNYGVHLKTALTYSGALLAAALSAWVAAPRVSRWLRAVLRWYGGLLTAVLVSTYWYTTSPLWHAIHLALGVTFLSFEVIVGAACARRQRPRASRVGVALLVLGATAGVVDLADVAPVLFIAQMVIGVGFGVVLVGAVGSDV